MFNPRGPIHLKRRRTLAGFATVAAIIAFMLLLRRETDRLGMPEVASGFTLMVCLTLLMLLGVRKRLSFLPLGNVSTWLQVHLYLGIFTTVVFLAHAPVLFADGILERTLSILFLTVSASGFYGIYASRTVPRKLTAIGEQHRFDQIPWTRRQIAVLAQQTLEATSDPSAVDVLEDFYQQALSSFFHQRPSVGYVLAPNGTRRRKMLGALKDLDRYLEPEGRVLSGRLAALIRKRDDLDYQFALQLRLRCWVMIHSLLSLLLYAASIFHAVVALSFIDWS